jgi:hypothetical protein
MEHILDLIRTISVAGTVATHFDILHTNPCVDNSTLI